MKAYRRIASPRRSRPPAAAPLPLPLSPRPSVPTQMPLRAGRRAPALGMIDPWRAPDPMARGRY